MKPLLLIFSSLLLNSCSKDKPGPEYIFMELGDTQATIPMRPNRLFPNENSMGMPPEGTVSKDLINYPYADNPEAASELSNPVPRTKEYVERGRIVYERSCLPCHGPTGEGNGNILERNGLRTGFPMPPTLHSNKVRKWTDGRLHHVIMVGQNGVMPSYAARIDEVDRWSVIHYLRVLSKSEYATKEDKEKVAHGSF